VSHKTSAEVILDSVTPNGDETRLTSIYVVFPKMILGERNRHRGFSLSDRSSRAVPPEKLIAEVMEDPAMPAKFRRRAKGMGGGEEQSGADLVDAREVWMRGSRCAADYASFLNDLGLAKEIVNRPLDPHIRMHSLQTATRDVWLNFFGLRLDAGADPTIQVLAQRCFEAYSSSTPRLLQPGEWHLPFVDDDWTRDYYDPSKSEIDDYLTSYDAGSFAKNVKDSRIEVAKCLSAARCAHLSYNDLETGRRMTVERALAIYDRLVGSRPIHASPCEHQATPDEVNRKPVQAHWPESWVNPHLHGNFCGWIQHRKTLPGEAVAPLPEGYAL
jgi:thymidylate synthase ThyX